MLRWYQYGLLTAALLCLTTTACAALALALALQDTPRLQRTDTLPPREAAQLKDLAFLLNHSTGNAPEVHHLPLSAPLLDLGLHDVVKRLLRGSARITLAPSAAELQASVPLSALPWPAIQVLKPLGRWVNVSMQLQERPAGPPRLTALHIGQLPVPPGLAMQLAQLAAHHTGWQAEWAGAQKMVQAARLRRESATLSLVIPAHLQQRLRDKLIPTADQARLQPYAQRLADLISAAPPGPVPLAQLMPPLFALAQHQSSTLVALSHANPHTQATQENRAALQALAQQSSGQPWERIAPQATRWRLPPPRPITLHGREDLAQHYLISAVIASAGGGRIANMMALYKELADAREGSGFSFDDMAADRAGTRLGQRAMHAAITLQAQLANTALQDDHLMPPVAGLPSFMPEAEFRRRFGAPGSANYQREMAAIEARINELPVLK